MYQASLCFLHFKGHRVRAPNCGCDDTVIERYVRYGVEEHDPYDVLKSAMSEGINRLTSLDHIVYVIAKRRLLWEIEYIQQHYDGTFLC